MSIARRIKALERRLAATDVLVAALQAEVAALRSARTGGKTRPTGVLLTPKQVAAFTGESRSTVQNRMNAGEYRVVLRGVQRLVDPDSLGAVENVGFANSETYEPVNIGLSTCKFASRSRRKFNL